MKKSYNKLIDNILTCNLTRLYDLYNLDHNIIQYDHALVFEGIAKAIDFFFKSKRNKEKK